MWSFVWLLPGLFAAAAGVYVNTPCIRSLLKCSPFRLSLLDGKFSDRFIEDHIILRRQCRSMDAFLECMQETALMHCNNITPAEEKFIKTRLYVEEVCNDVNNMRKAYFKSAACINRQMNRVHEACFPDYYVELVNTSNLISLEGSCVLQTLLISCRKDVIREICGPEAGDLYGRVKAVDMNLDFLCLERRDLQSPEFLLDVTINSYISLLIEIMRPVLRMERNFLQGIEETKDELESPQSREEGEGFESKDFSIKKRTKIPPHIQELPNNNWRRSGDIPPNLETVCAGDEAGTPVCAGVEAKSTSMYFDDEAESTVYAGDEAESTVYAGDEAESTVYAGDEAVVDPGSAPSTSSSEFNTNQYSSLDCFIILENVTLDNLQELEAEQSHWDGERLKAFDECLEKLMELEMQTAALLSKKVLNGLTTLFATEGMESNPSLFTGHIKGNNLTKREGEVVLPVTELGRAQHSISHEFKRETQAQGKVEQTVKESIGALMTLKSLAASRVTLNYVLIGESYIPIEINYVDGSEAKSFHHNLKISGKKFKFFTSTPAISPTFTDSDSCVNEPSDVLIKGAEETSEIKSGFDGESSEFSCPSTKSNKTPQVSNFRPSDLESELNKHFNSLNYKVDSVEETEHVSGESFKNDFSEKTEESSKVANKDIRRSGDIEDGPKKIHQGIDLETTIALKFYRELLTVLASMLPSDNSEANKFLKRATDVMDAYRNYLKGNKEVYPHTLDTTLPTVDAPESRVFQKRSMDTDDSFNQKQTSPKTTLNKDSTREMGLRFDVKHTPESLVRIEMYVSEEKSPDVKYLVMGEYKVPLEIHFDVQNKSYVHYTEVDIPERTLKVDVQMSPHPPMTEDEIRASGNLEELAV